MLHMQTNISYGQAKAKGGNSIIYKLNCIHRCMCILYIYIYIYISVCMHILHTYIYVHTWYAFGNGAKKEEQIQTQSKPFPHYFVVCGT